MVKISFQLVFGRPFGIPSKTLIGKALHTLMIKRVRHICSGKEALFKSFCQLRDKFTQIHNDSSTIFAVQRQDQIVNKSIKIQPAPGFSRMLLAHETLIWFETRSSEMNVAQVIKHSSFIILSFHISVFSSFCVQCSCFSVLALLSSFQFIRGGLGSI